MGEAREVAEKLELLTQLEMLPYSVSGRSRVDAAACVGGASRPLCLRRTRSR